MTKRILFILLIMSMTVVATAQRSNSSHRKQKEAVAIGVRFGGNLAHYAYPDSPACDTLSFDLMQQRLHPVMGINMEIPLMGGRVYLAPEVTLAGRGDARAFYSDNWNTDVNYRAEVHYLEARLPVSVSFDATSWLKPYVFAAPIFGVAIPTTSPFTSQITQYSNDTPQSFNDTVAVDLTNMAPYDLGMLAGAGLRFRINFTDFSLLVKMEAGYHFGFMDTYSEAEHNDQAQALNVNAYNVEGKRLNRGLEAAVTIALPLQFNNDDACANWSSGHRSRRHQHYGF